MTLQILMRIAGRLPEKTLQKMSSLINNAANGSKAFLLENVRIDPRSHEIGLNGSSTRIEPRNMRVLLRLVSEPGEVIDRAALLEAGWADAPYVADEALTKSISSLRAALLKAGLKSDIIETVPKKGYRISRDANLRLSELNVPRQLSAIPVEDSASSLVGLRRELRATRRMFGGFLALTLIATLGLSFNSSDPEVRVKRMRMPAGTGVDSGEIQVLVDTTLSIQRYTELSTLDLASLTP